MSDENASENNQGQIPNFEEGATHNGLIAVKQSSIRKVIAALESETPPPLDAFVAALEHVAECGCLPPCGPNDPPGTICD